MSLLQRYLRGPSALTVKQHADKPQSPMRQIYLNSFHAAVLDPMSNNFDDKFKEYPKDWTIQSNENKAKEKISKFKFENNLPKSSKKKPQRPDVVPIALGPLPDFGDDSFEKKLKEKIDLIKIDLNFNDPEADRAAKQVRLSAINEICIVFNKISCYKNNVNQKNTNCKTLNSNSNNSNNSSNISNKNSNGKDEKEDSFIVIQKKEKVFQIIFNFFVNDLLFRQIGNRADKDLFCDEMVAVIDPEVGQIGLAYSSLKKTIPDRIELFDRKFIKRLFGRFYVPDINERSQIVQIILDIAFTFKEKRNSREMIDFCSSLCFDQLNLYLAGQKVPYILMPCLSILYYLCLENNNNNNSNEKNNDIKNENNQSNNNKNGSNNSNKSNNNNSSNKNLIKFKNSFIHSVLPILGSKHFMLVSQQMQLIVKMLLNQGRDYDLILKTAHAVLVHFPMTQTNKASEFVYLLIFCLEKLKTDDFRRILKPVRSIIIRCMLWDHPKVLLAVCRLWEGNENLDNKLCLYSSLLFPFIFPICLKIVNESWCSDMKNRGQLILSGMNRVNAFEYTELCTQHIKEESKRIQQRQNIAQNSIQSQKGFKNNSLRSNSSCLSCGDYDNLNKNYHLSPHLSVRNNNNNNNKTHKNRFSFIFNEKKNSFKENGENDNENNKDNLDNSNNMDNMDRVRVWGTIARESYRRDREINIQEKLTDIQITFPTSYNDQMKPSSLNQKRPRSSTSCVYSVPKSSPLSDQSGGSPIVPKVANIYIFDENNQKAPIFDENC